MDLGAKTEVPTWRGVRLRRRPVPPQAGTRRRLIETRRRPLGETAIAADRSIRR